MVNFGGSFSLVKAVVDADISVLDSAHSGLVFVCLKKTGSGLVLERLTVDSVFGSEFRQMQKCCPLGAEYLQILAVKLLAVNHEIESIKQKLGLVAASS